MNNITKALLGFFLLSGVVMGQNFTKAPGGAIDIAINHLNGKVYVVGATSKNIFEWSASAKNWRKVSSTNPLKAKQVAIDRLGKIWITDENRKIMFRGTGNTWTQVNPYMWGENISSSSQGKIYSCFATNGKVIRWTGSRWDHEKKMPAKMIQVAMKNDVEGWGIQQDKSIHYFKNGITKKVAGLATDIAIDPRTGDVYVVGVSKRVFKWDSSIKNWKALSNTRNDVKYVAAYNGTVWFTTTRNEIYYGKPSNEFVFSPNKKKVMILIHGITVSEKTTQAGKDEGVNSAKHPQFYWGYEFMKLMSQSSGNSMTFIPQPGTRVPSKRFTKQQWDEHTRPIVPGALMKKPFIVKGDNAKAEIMLTFRDGAETMMKQVKATINQIHDGYQKYYGKLPESQQPMIYMVAHSFGGIVCRGILSNPTSADLVGHRLTAEERRKADFIRNRTVWLTTLSTPHEGSPLPALSQDIHQGLNDLASFMVIPGLKKKVRDLAKEHITGDRPSLNDIKNNRFYLSNMLKPANAKRTNGELIPIYTLTGANPGHTFFLNSRPYMSPVYNSSKDLTDYYSNKGYNKGVGESFSLMMVEVLGKSLLKPNVGIWPKVYSSVSYGDRFKTPYYGAQGSIKVGNTRITASTSAPVISALATNGIRIGMSKDGYFDSDGFVSFNSGHGLNLGSREIGYFGNQRTYTLGGKQTSGSWYRIYGNTYGQAHPWDYDNHRTICFNPGTGAFIGNYLLKNGGAYARKGIWSTWNGRPSTASLGQKRIRIEITYVEDVDKDMDVGVPPFSRSDFRSVVRIGPGKWQKSGTIDNVDKVSTSHFQNGKNYVWNYGQAIENATIVPVIIRLLEADNPDPDDLCSLSSRRPYQEELMIYVDTRNGTIYGDVNGRTGNTVHYVKGSSRGKNNAKIGFRVKVY
ncbi:MAG: hypothetical protein AAFY71_23105 [Bacteroidota bacterium]